MKVLIVGAGLSGSVLARVLAESNIEIDLIEKRNHIAGNAYDFLDENNIRVHKYGPHIFHTNNKNVFEWLSQFTEWLPYKHKVKALLNDGRYVTLPVNSETKEIVGKENIVEIFYRPYSEKMWGMKLEDISSKIIDRVPVRDDDNEYYFPNDKYQFMPANGYTHLVKNILNTKNINLSLNTSYEKKMNKDYDYIFLSLPIDEYYDYCYGELPYRSLKFENVTLPYNKFLPVATVNFTHKGPSTRITEWKHFPNHGTNDFFTSLCYEIPCDYKENNYERFYPVKDSDGVYDLQYKKYKELSEKENNVRFIGRLGLYKYIDMDQCVNIALQTAKKFLKEIK